MLALETVAEIRADHFRDKVPIKAIARKRRVSRNTVRKVVPEGSEAFGSAAGKRQPKPKLGPWIGELERMFAEIAKLMRRERPTLMRVHEDLSALGGTPVKVKAAHFRLCHSRMAFVQLYRRESLEMLADAHKTGHSRSSAAPASGASTTT